MSKIWLLRLFQSAKKGIKSAVDFGENLFYTKAMIEKKIRETILENHMFQQGDYVIIGLSGGPDSMCLFFALQRLCAAFGLHLYAVHVNHMFRQDAAEEDQHFVETVCQKAQIPCDVFVRDCAEIAKTNGISSEEAGREVRYEAFYEVAARLMREQKISGQAIKIAVAQNKNDQAETVLLRLLRGTGTDGLAGMHYVRAGQYGTTIVRPLLDVDRKEIEAYCAENGLTPRIDHTNAEPIYTRNKIRLQLLPYLSSHFNADVTDALCRLARISSEDRAYLWTQADQAFDALRAAPSQTEENRIVLDREGLKTLAPAIRRRVLVRAFTEAGLVKDISEAHLIAAEKLIKSSRASGKAVFPKGFCLEVSYQKAMVEQEQKSPENSDPLSAKKVEGFILKTKRIGKTEFRQEDIAFDCEKIQACFGEKQIKIDFRTRQAGDRFKPRGMKTGSKKLQDYLVDQKIPKEHRDKLLLCCIGSEVLWIFDPTAQYSKTSENYAVSADSERILVLEIVEKL